MRIVDSAVLLALITGAFYCSSTSYIDSYLNYMLLDSDVLERNFNSIVYDGLVKNLIFISYAIIGVLIVAVIDSLIRVTLHKRKINHIEGGNKTPEKQADDEFERYHSKRMLSVFYVFCIFVFFIGLMAHYEGDGKIKANEIKANIQSGSAPASNIPDYKNKVYLLFCGSNNCAFYDKEDKKIIYQNQGSSNIIFTSDKDLSPSKS